jgi:hypothetical protein
MPRHLQEYTPALFLDHCENSNCCGIDNYQSCDPMRALQPMAGHPSPPRGQPNGTSRGTATAACSLGMPRDEEKTYAISFPSSLFFFNDAMA